MTKEEQEKMFNDNLGLVYSIAKKYLINYANEIDDIIQCGLIGLWKSVLAFDESRNSKFSSLACIIITNEINYYLRHVKKKYEYTISINTPISEELIIEDTLEDNNNSIDILLNKLTCEEVFSYFDEIQNPKHKEIYLLYMSKRMTQKEIADKFNITQASVSRTVRKINKKLKEKYLNKGEEK